MHFKDSTLLTMILGCSGTSRRPVPKREGKSDSSNSNSNNSHHPHSHPPQLHRHRRPLEVPRRQRSIRGCDYSGDAYTLLVLAAQVMSVVWCVIYTSCTCGTGDECGMMRYIDCLYLGHRWWVWYDALYTLLVLAAQVMSVVYWVLGYQWVL